MTENQLKYQRESPLSHKIPKKINQNVLPW